MRDTSQLILKSREEIELMRKAGRIAAKVLEELKKNIAPGITTIELDRVAEKIIIENNAIPSFKDYPNPYRGGRKFPSSICTSINNEVIHGIPSNRKLAEGDIIGIDCGVTYMGYIGDAAITLPVGKVSPKLMRLIEVTEKALGIAIEAAKCKGRLHDISYAIQSYVEGMGFSVVKQFCGHGVGIAVHEYPPVPNYGKIGTGPKLREGMTFAIEPMVNMGSDKVRVEKDMWTVVTVDGKPSAHFEHTVAITKDGVEILTLP